MVTGTVAGKVAEMVTGTAAGTVEERPNVDRLLE
jgi:hypothetical protein